MPNPSNPYLPDTNAVLDAYVSLFSNLTYVSGPNIGQTIFQLVKKGKIKNVTATIPCLEIYVNTDIFNGGDDKRERRALGGRMRDVQSFVFLALADETDSTSAEATIGYMRDAIVNMIFSHVKLNGLATNVAHSTVQNNGQFVNIKRNQKEYRGYIVETLVFSDWTNANYGQQ